MQVNIILFTDQEKNDYVFAGFFTLKTTSSQIWSGEGSLMQHSLILCITLRKSMQPWGIPKKEPCIVIQLFVGNWRQSSMTQWTGP